MSWADVLREVRKIEVKVPVSERDWVYIQAVAKEQGAECIEVVEAIIHRFIQERTTEDADNEI